MASVGKAVESSQALKGIVDDLRRYLEFIQDGLTPAVMNRVGDVVIGIMLDLVSKGVSPIEGAGRFPPYLAAELRNRLKKEKSAITKALKANKQALFKFRRMNQRQLLVAQKNANRRDVGNLGYPFSVQKQYPGKRPRPVNLFLSGAFLAALEAHVVGTAGQFSIEVGFFKDSEAIKEIGHREGAGGQPLRPIIPIDREEFVQTIQDAIWEIIGEEIDRAAARG